MPTLLSKTTYSYDDAHNRVQKVKDGVTADYSYNELNQLTGFTEGTRQVAFAYDDNGNRVSRTEGGTTDSYSYDYENRLVSLQKGGVSYAYTYDYRTRRVERVEGSTTTKIVFSGGTSVQEYEGTNKTVEYVRGSDFGGGIGGILYTLRSGQPSYTHYNNRGDVVAKTNDSKALTYQATYEAFGKRTQEVGQTQDRQKANTKDEDPTGLLNEGFRYRDLETGSFITRDPLGFIDGPNLYTYVHQNPWTKFDPEGLEWSWGAFGRGFLEGVAVSAIAGAALLMVAVVAPVAAAVVGVGLAVTALAVAAAEAGTGREVNLSLTQGPSLGRQLSGEDYSARAGNLLGGLAVGGAVKGMLGGKGGPSGASPKPVEAGPQNIAAAAETNARNTAAQATSARPETSASSIVKYDPAIALRQGADPSNVVPSSYSVVRGGKEGPMPKPGTTFSGSVGPTAESAAQGVPHGTIRESTAEAIRGQGGTVELKPELTRSGNLNLKHANVTERGTKTTFSDPRPNPVPKKERIE